MEKVESVRICSSRGCELSEQFVEYGAIRSTEPLRQGDVLEAVAENSSMWQRHLLVITADCDFAHGKNQGRVTCVPLLTADEYLLELQIPRLREKIIQRPVAAMQSLIVRAKSVTLTAHRLREWASEDDEPTICETLGLIGEDRDQALKLLHAIRSIDSKADSIDDAMKRLIDGQAAVEPAPKRETALSRVIDPIRQAYSQPPGDALFIGAIGESLGDGYFAYLRHLEQVLEPNISLGLSGRSSTYRRISRLKDRFSHALVQRFAMVFLSIGLPDEYEENRNLHAAYMGDGLK